MKKHQVMMIVHILMAAAAFYAFRTPDLFGSMGYDLAIDGIVVARGLCFIFALYNIGKAVSSGLDRND